MLSRIQLGVIAHGYLHSRAGEVPHFEKNARYIKDIFLQMQEDFPHMTFSQIEVDCFCKDLARTIFQNEARATCDLLASETFFGMCYFYAKGILYREGICAGSSLRAQMQTVASACDLPVELIYLFFKTISDEIWAASM